MHRLRIIFCAVMFAAGLGLTLSASYALPYVGHHEWVLYVMAAVGGVAMFLAAVLAGRRD